MAHKNKITSIIQPTTEVLDWVVETLKTYDGWHVEKYSGSSCSKIFKHIPEMQLPAVVVSYRGSFSNDEFPRRTLNFSVIVATEDVGDSETAAEKSFPLIDKAMEILDYEEYNGVLFKYKRDIPFALLDSSIAAYELSFIGVDC